MDQDKKEAAFSLNEEGYQAIILADAAGQPLSSALSVAEQVPFLGPIVA